MRGLRLQAGEEPQGLGVALETPDPAGDLGERPFPVVPEGRVAEIVGEAGGVDDVRVAAEGVAEFPAHLGDLEGVGEARADEVVGRGAHHLGLGAEAAQARGVDDARTVALEGAPPGGLGWLGDPAGRVGRHVGAVVAELDDLVVSDGHVSILGHADAPAVRRGRPVGCVSP